MRLILGSQSPRRRELLNSFALPFEQISSQFNESLIPFKGDPASYALEIAQGKASALTHQYPDAAILTADTVVYKEPSCYGKPQDDQHAFRMLKELQGSWHHVFTGVTLSFQGQAFSGVEETKVLFNPLTDSQIQQYLRALHWEDKAGGYAIQLAGSLLVRKIEGCYYNVLGLPINVVAPLLLKANINLWDHLK
ncbi:MAG: Maf family protein [Parachlamydiaceae bacterium]